MKKGLISAIGACLILTGCVAATPTPVKTAAQTSAPATVTNTPPSTLTLTATVSSATATPGGTVPAASATVTPGGTVDASGVPVFEHIILIMFENRSFDEVIGSIHAGDKHAPTFNKLAQENTLLTQYYAITHPSLPNYLAIVGGDTFGIHSDCELCFVDQPSLPDRLEAAGRTWRTYQEDLPLPCFVGSRGKYVQRHDPFIYFDPIRTNPLRCELGVVSLDALPVDLAAGHLPDYAFIEPNLCNSAHDCPIDTADQWLAGMMDTLLSSNALGEKYLIFITFDEGRDNSSCCGLPESAGGRVVGIVISPLAKKGFQDDTPLTHYGFLKTVLSAWGLPALGQTGNAETGVITKAWK